MGHQAGFSHPLKSILLEFGKLLSIETCLVERAGSVDSHVAFVAIGA